MANVIRYKRDQPTKRGLKKGNAVVGTGEENYGPTSTTGYTSGITPPNGGYTVYTLSGENDPAIYVANNTTDLINIANTLGGDGEITTEDGALFHLNNTFNVWVVSSVPDNTITDGLKLHLDANNKSSYPGSGFIWKDISGNKKPLSEVRVLGAHHSGYQYPPFYNFFRINCQITNEPVVNDLPNNWPVSTVVENFDLVIADEYVWAMGGAVIEWMKELVDAGVSCIGVGNDQRGTIFVSGYNSGTRQSHDIRMDSKSRIGLNGRIFSYGSGDVYGGITSLTNGAKPLYYRDDVDRITGYVYENQSTGASFWFDQEGLQSTDTELFEAGLDYVTRNIGLRWYPTNGPAYNSNGWFDLDGSNDYIDLGEDSIISPDNQGWTAEYWFSSDSASTLQHFNSAESDGFNANWLALYNSKLAVWNVSPGYWRYGSTVIQSNTWYQAVFVCDPGGTNMRYYINGVREGGNHVGNSWSAAYSSLETRYIGRYEYNGSYSRYFNGKMSKVKMYDRALSDEEVAQNYYGGGIVTDGLIRALDFSNIVSYESGNSGKDLTGNDTFTLINTPTKINDYGGGLQCSTNEFIVLDDKTATNYVTVEVLYRRDSNEGGEDILWNKESCWEMRDDNGNVQIALMASNQSWFWYDTGIDVAVGEIAHITMAYNGDDIKTYKNGILEHTYDYPNGGVLANQTTAYPKFNSRNATKTSVQNPGNRTCFIWRIYDRALTADEVLQNFNAQKARFL